MIVRLRRSTREHRRAFVDRDVIRGARSHQAAARSPVPTLDFEELFEPLRTYVGFTPLNNAAGGPAISLALGASEQRLPIGVHVSADLGDERTLLELAFELEEVQRFRRITEG